jgi:hypothetical protein
MGNRLPKVCNLAVFGTQTSYTSIVQLIKKISQADLSTRDSEISILNLIPTDADLNKCFLLNSVVENTKVLNGSFNDIISWDYEIYRNRLDVNTIIDTFNDRFKYISLQKIYNSIAEQYSHPILSYNSFYDLILGGIEGQKLSEKDYLNKRIKSIGLSKEYYKDICEGIRTFIQYVDIVTSDNWLSQEKIESSYKYSDLNLNDDNLVEQLERLASDIYDNNPSEGILFIEIPTGKSQKFQYYVRLELLDKFLN